MKQKILKRARNTVDAFLHNHCADTPLDVLSVNPDVDGYGDEFLWVDLKYDDGEDAKALPDPLARIQLADRLRTELLGADVEAFPVVSFIAESEVGGCSASAAGAPVASRQRKAVEQMLEALPHG